MSGLWFNIMLFSLPHSSVEKWRINIHSRAGRARATKRWQSRQLTSWWFRWGSRSTRSLRWGWRWAFRCSCFCWWSQCLAHLCKSFRAPAVPLTLSMDNWLLIDLQHFHCAMLSSNCLRSYAAHRSCRWPSRRVDSGRHRWSANSLNIGNRRCWMWTQAFDVDMRFVLFAASMVVVVAGGDASSGSCFESGYWADSPPPSNCNSCNNRHWCCWTSPFRRWAKVMRNCWCIRRDKHNEGQVTLGPTPSWRSAEFSSIAGRIRCMCNFRSRSSSMAEAVAFASVTTTLWDSESRCLMSLPTFPVAFPAPIA